MAAPKIIRIDEAPTRQMRGGRGIQTLLVGSDDGAVRLDVHINLLNPTSGPGPYHVHRESETVYIILEGSVSAVVDGTNYLVGPDEVVFIPPGIPHSAGSDGTGPARVIEIYAPVGRDFHILPEPDSVNDGTL